MYKLLIKLRKDKEGKYFFINNSNKAIDLESNKFFLNVIELDFLSEFINLNKNRIKSIKFLK